MSAAINNNVFDGFTFLCTFLWSFISHSLVFSISIQPATILLILDSSPRDLLIIMGIRVSKTQDNIIGSS